MHSDVGVRQPKYVYANMRGTLTRAASGCTNCVTACAHEKDPPDDRRASSLLVALVALLALGLARRNLVGRGCGKHAPDNVKE